MSMYQDSRVKYERNLIFKSKESRNCKIIQNHSLSQVKRKLKVLQKIWILVVLNEYNEWKVKERYTHLEII